MFNNPPIRIIFTGTPGSGKTTLINQLKLLNYGVINEAATDYIAQQQSEGSLTPWNEESFIDEIIKIQKERQLFCTSQKDIQLYDRSPFCTYALSQFLSAEPHQPSSILREEIDRCLTDRIYHTHVIFLENLGFVEQNSVRTISLQDALKFEQIHQEVYQRFGFISHQIPHLPLDSRLNYLLNTLQDILTEQPKVRRS